MRGGGGGLDCVADQPGRRRHLLALAEALRLALRQEGIDCGDSASQIVPIMIGPAGEAVRVSLRLLEAGFLVPAIRPPTVPRGGSRLRVSLCSAHTGEQVDGFVAALLGAMRHGGEPAGK